MSYVIILDPTYFDHGFGRPYVSMQIDAIWLSASAFVVVAIILRAFMPQFRSTISWTHKEIQWQELWFHGKAILPWEYVSDIVLDVKDRRIMFELEIGGSVALPKRFCRSEQAAAKMFDTLHAQWVTARTAAK